MDSKNGERVRQHHHPAATWDFVGYLPWKPKTKKWKKFDHRSKCYKRMLSISQRECVFTEQMANGYQRHVRKNSGKAISP